MKISHRLTLIVLLTLFEITVTLWAAFEISTGAAFHRLNFLHVKYQSVFAEATYRLKADDPANAEDLRAMVLDIRQQPVDCIARATPLNLFIMRSIGTDIAIELCKKDIVDADRALATIQRFEAREISRESLITQLDESSRAFSANSSAFEEPINKTVSFILSVMIPFVVAISLTNIVLIIYLARAIRQSLRYTIDMLNNSNSTVSFADQIEQTPAEELKELLTAAQARMAEELKVRQTAEYLEHQVKLRTASLTQANDELAQFSYRASHDLKSPLSTSKGLARLIPADIEAGAYNEAKNSAYAIAAQMSKLEHLVVDILELARADLSAIETESVSIQEVVSAIRNEMAGELSSNNIDFQLEYKGRFTLLASRTRIRQSLENLVSNAIKYCALEPVGRKVLIKTRDREDRIEIFVEDNGRGVPEGAHDQLFERFTRFHPDVADGFGLGLAIVRRHIEQMHGTISCESLPIGTRFIIKLPYGGAELSAAHRLPTEPNSPTVAVAS